jgi:hypothetical protein
MILIGGPIDVAQTFNTWGWLPFVPTILIWRGSVIYPLFIVVRVNKIYLLSL